VGCTNSVQTRQFFAFVGGIEFVYPTGCEREAGRTLPAARPAHHGTRAASQPAPPLSRARLLRRLSATRPQRRQDPELRGTLLALRAVARRIQQLTAEERELAREIETLTSKLAPRLLSQPGIGPLLAAQIVLSWSHRGRLVSEAAFARLASAAPIPASSGQTIRHRLDRSGDPTTQPGTPPNRRHRRRTHQPTIDYIER
jgi:transposase